MVISGKQGEITHGRMAENLGDEYADVYLGGADDLEIEWVDEGTAFRIHEYDGFESVVIYDIGDYFIA